METKTGTRKTEIMGVVNLSSESFYRGSYHPPEELSHVIGQMLEDGADIVDIGARSTAPGSPQISVSEELTRIKKAMESLDDALLSAIKVSVDTQYSEVASCALSLGASMVNDVSGFATDPKLAEVVVEYDCPIVLMASFRKPGDHTTLEEAIRASKLTIERAIELGVSEERIILDPGVGKWIPQRSVEHDLEIIREIRIFRQFGYPLLIGISRKSFIGNILGVEPEERLYGSLGATALVVGDVDIIRTHDVRETKDVVRIVEAVLGNK